MRKVPHTKQYRRESGDATCYLNMQVGISVYGQQPSASGGLSTCSRRSCLSSRSQQTVRHCTSQSNNCTALAALGLPSPPDLEGRSPRSVFSPTTLAYLGDAVWEVLVRSHVFEQQHSKLLKQGRHGPQGRAFNSAAAPRHRRLPEVQSLNSAAMQHSNARSQAAYHDLLISTCPQQPGPVPTDASPSDLPAGGSQVPTSTSGPMHPGHQVVLSSEERDILRWARNASGLNPPSGTDTLSYKKATALEALVAHLYLTDSDRCVKLVNALLLSSPANDTPVRNPSSGSPAQQ